MPKSKRSKKVVLTQVEKKGRQRKEVLAEQAQENVEKYKYVYVVSFQNLRNVLMQQVREEWRGEGTFLGGKIKVLAHGLGHSINDEFRPELHKISQMLGADTMLLFTDASPKDVATRLTAFSETDFARSGAPATHTVTLSEGPLPQFPFSMETTLRKLGMPVSLKQGDILLDHDYTVCKDGEKLTPEQARILKLMDIKMATMRFGLKAVWTDGKFKSFV